MFIFRMKPMMAYARRGSNHIEDVERGKTLVEAAKNGDTELVLRLLEAGVSVNAEEYNKFLFYASKNYVTPLQVAAAQGHLLCLKLLIDYGADLNARDRFDVTAVHMAAEHGQYECLKQLLDSGADCCVATKYSKKGSYTAHPHLGGTTPLHLAAARSFTECVKELIQFGADYNAVDEKGRTSLYIAAERGLEECVLAHLYNAIGRDILSLPGFDSGDTPLHFCVMHGLVKCVEELLKHGSDVNLRNCSGFSSLDYGVLFNLETEAMAPQILKLLVLKGYNCDINLADYAGLTPLHYVSFSDGVRFRRRPELAAFLISCGSNFNICNQRGYTLIQAEMRPGNNDLTILKAIVKSSLHIPPLSSLNLTAPPPSPPPHNPLQNHNELAHHNYFHRGGNWNHNQNEAPPVAGDMPGINNLAVLRYHPFHHNHIFPVNGAIGDVEAPDNNWVGPGPGVNQYGGSNNSRLNGFRTKYEWYREICSKPRSLQHYCRYVIRTSMGHKRLKHAKDLPIPTSLQQYLLLEYDEFK